MIIAISYDLLISDEAANIVLQLERRGDEFLVALDKRVISEDTAKKAIDGLGIKKYRFMTDNDLDMPQKIAYTKDNLVDIILTEQPKGISRTRSFIYFLLAIFPITGIFGIHNVYDKDKKRFRIHFYSIILAILIVAVLILSANTSFIKISSNSNPYFGLLIPFFLISGSYALAAIEGIFRVLSSSIILAKYDKSPSTENDRKAAFIVGIGTIILSSIIIVAREYNYRVLYNVNDSMVSVFLPAIATIISVIGALYSSKHNSRILYLNVLLAIISFVLTFLGFFFM